MVYYLDEVEKRKIQQDLIPRIRESNIEDELRGWNWANSPLTPYSDEILLPVWEVSSTYCKTFRDTYLRHKIIRKSIPPTKNMFYGMLIHRVIQRVFSNAKKLIYLGKINNFKYIMRKQMEKEIDEIIKSSKQTFNYLKIEREINTDEINL